MSSSHSLPLAPAPRYFTLISAEPHLGQNEKLHLSPLSRRISKGLQASQNPKTSGGIWCGDWYRLWTFMASPQTSSGSGRRDKSRAARALAATRRKYNFRGRSGSETAQPPWRQCRAYALPGRTATPATPQEKVFPFWQFPRRWYAALDWSSGSTWPPPLEFSRTLFSLKT